MYCKHCGKKLSDDAVFCNYCGVKQDIPSNDNLNLNTFENSNNVSEHVANNQNQIESFKTASNDYSDSKTITKKSKGKKLLICAIFVALAIIVAIIIIIKSTNEKQNAYSIGVSSSDYTFIFDDSDGTNVISTITPKYDLKEFSVKITYYAEKGLLNYYEEEYNIGEVKAGTQIKYTKTISDIEKEIKGSFYYASASIVSGKKQYKYFNNTQEPIYNEECSFTFHIYYNLNSISFNIDITNNTNYYISELRAFRVTINYENNKKCSFYTQRIKFQNNLAPNDTIIVKNLSGNTSHNGMDSSLSPYVSSIYSTATYQVIYA